MTGGFRSARKFSGCATTTPRRRCATSTANRSSTSRTGAPVFAGFVNGALGIVRRQTERGAWLEFDDGAEDEIRAPDLEQLTHGWPVSVHKAQGSEFRRVIVPLAKSRLLDRTMVYTAVTRAVDTVVLVGHPALLHQVVEAASTCTCEENNSVVRPLRGLKALPFLSALRHRDRRWQQSKSSNPTAAFHGILLLEP